MNHCCTLKFYNATVTGFDMLTIFKEPTASFNSCQGFVLRDETRNTLVGEFSNKSSNVFGFGMVRFMLIQDYFFQRGTI